MVEKGEKKVEKEEDFKHRVRVSGTILEGNKDIVRALTQIKGIGRQVSSSLIRTLKFDKRGNWEVYLIWRLKK